MCSSIKFQKWSGLWTKKDNENRKFETIFWKWSQGIFLLMLSPKLPKNTTFKKCACCNWLFLLEPLDFPRHFLHWIWIISTIICTICPLGHQKIMVVVYLESFCGIRHEHINGLSKNGNIALCVLCDSLKKLLVQVIMLSHH